MSKKVSFKASFSTLPKVKIESSEAKKKFEELVDSKGGFTRGLAGFTVDYATQMKRLAELEDITASNVNEQTAKRLKEAVHCYVNEQFLACIATSGIIAEELALAVIEDNLPEKELKLLDVTGAKHDRRLNVLLELKLISNDCNSWFREIQKLRNRYVHASKENSDEVRLKRDAKSCLNNLIKIIREK